MTTTRTRPTSSGLSRLTRVATCLFLLIAGACEPAPKVVPSGDVPDAPQLARATAAVLLQLSAYDYGLAGSLSGQTTRAVSPDRWATVARTLLPKLADITSSSLAAASNAAGPVRDAVVSLADSLNDLSKNAGTYADGRDPAVFAKTTGDVTTSWDRVVGLAVKLPLDTELQKIVNRGRSFTVTPTSAARFAVQAGPYASAADADAAAKKIGAVISVTRAAPFVVRVATYPTKAQADAAAAALRPKGVDVTAVIEERSYAFERGGTVPDQELWREPARIIDGLGGARRVAFSPDGRWIAMGSDDGTVAIFNAATAGLVALPKFPSGVSALLFSADSAWLFAGGASATVLFVPSGNSPLSAAQQLKFPGAITQALYVNVPTARAFVAVSKSATGIPGAGGGLIGARAPDGAVLGAPFPITTPAAGAAIAAAGGELYIATTTAGQTDVELLRLGAERVLRSVVRVPGTVQDLALDAKGDRAAVITDQGTYRFSPHGTSPIATLQRVGAPMRDVAFGADGTFVQVDKDTVTATGPDGVQRWQAPLTDGQRVVLGATRTLVWDGAGGIWAIGADGTVDALGIDGPIQDLIVSADGKRAGVVLDGRRALVFELQ